MGLGVDGLEALEENRLAHLSNRALFSIDVYSRIVEFALCLSSLRCPILLVALGSADLNLETTESSLVRSSWGWSSNL